MPFYHHLRLVTLCHSIITYCLRWRLLPCTQHWHLLYANNLRLPNHCVRSRQCYSHFQCNILYQATEVLSQVQRQSNKVRLWLLGSPADGKSRDLSRYPIYLHRLFPKLPYTLFPLVLRKEASYCVAWCQPGQLDGKTNKQTGGNLKKLQMYFTNRTLNWKFTQGLIQYKSFEVPVTSLQLVFTMVFLWNSIFASRNFTRALCSCK